MFKTEIIGFLGNDAVVRESKNGAKFLSTSVGVTINRRGEQKTKWIDLIWYHYTENLVPYLKKGKNVIVHGDYDDEIRTIPDGSQRLQRSIMVNSLSLNSFGSGITNNGGEKSQSIDANETKRTSAAVTTDAVPEITIERKSKKATAEKTVQAPQVASADDDLPF